MTATENIEGKIGIGKGYDATTLATFVNYVDPKGGPINIQIEIYDRDDGVFNGGDDSIDITLDVGTRNRV